MNVSTSCTCHCNWHWVKCRIWSLHTSKQPIFVRSHHTTRGECILGMHSPLVAKQKCILGMHSPLVAKAKVHTRYALSSGCMAATYENHQRSGAYQVCTFDSARQERLPFLCTPPSAITEYLNRYAHPLPEGHVDLHTRLRIAYLSNTRLDGADYRTSKKVCNQKFYGCYPVHST